MVFEDHQVGRFSLSPVKQTTDEVDHIFDQNIWTRKILVKIWSYRICDLLMVLEDHQVGRCSLSPVEQTTNKMRQSFGPKNLDSLKNSGQQFEVV